MDTEFIYSLEKEQQKWLAIAVTGIIVADGVLDDSEIDFLENALSFLENEKMVDSLIEMVRQMRLPPLRPLTVEPSIGYRILRELIPVAAAGGTLTQTEIKFLEMAAKRLGFSDPDFIRSLINLTKLLVEYNLEDQRLAEMAASSNH